MKSNFNLTREVGPYSREFRTPVTGDLISHWQLNLFKRASCRILTFQEFQQHLWYLEGYVRECHNEI